MCANVYENSDLIENWDRRKFILILTEFKTVKIPLICHYW